MINSQALPSTSSFPKLHQAATGTLRGIAGFGHSIPGASERKTSQIKHFWIREDSQTDIPSNTLLLPMPVRISHFVSFLSHIMT